MAALIAINPRSFVHITLVIFDTDERSADAQRLRRVPKVLVKEAGAAGYRRAPRAHRLHGISPPTRCSFNDHAYRRFTETIKDALDPNGILMPGRHGIWPKSMRPER